MFIYFAFAILCGVIGLERVQNDPVFLGQIYFYKIVFAFEEDFDFSKNNSFTPSCERNAVSKP